MDTISPSFLFMGLHPRKKPRQVPPALAGLFVAPQVPAYAAGRLPARSTFKRLASVEGAYDTVAQRPTLLRRWHDPSSEVCAERNDSRVEVVAFR